MELFGYTIAELYMLYRWAKLTGLEVPAPSFSPPYKSTLKLVEAWERAGGRRPVREADILFLKPVLRKSKPFRVPNVHA